MSQVAFPLRVEAVLKREATLALRISFSEDTADGAIGDLATGQKESDRAA
ncbi:hypothetical protein MES5069_510001 [Mesorhizobium escarrei]|uniref:Uncharacterized protein n=1 Tax=Mesorhizobium escarrei TaxID=666018 RepID=A0ABN8K8U2_9HYPH|nr:hypothetical protein MES5069_510001 [Mesorhizobium escarrei]